MRHGAILLLIVLVTAAGAQEEYNPFDHYDNSMNVLLGWGIASVASGAVMVFDDDRRTQQIGTQNMIWGGLDAGYALFAKAANEWASLRIPPEDKALRYLRGLLISGVLDLVYLGTGIALITLGEDNDYRGHGIGITIQSGFLLGFDAINFGLTFR
jgi:hypothetical protein